MTESDKSLLERLRRPVPSGEYFFPDEPDVLHVQAANRIEQLLAELGTEQAMHTAWRKRAEEAEAAIIGGSAANADACEHGIEDGEYCEECNRAAKAARLDPHNETGEIHIAKANGSAHHKG